MTRHLGSNFCSRRHTTATLVCLLAALLLPLASPFFLANAATADKETCVKGPDGHCLSSMTTVTPYAAAASPTSDDDDDDDNVGEEDDSNIPDVRDFNEADFFDDDDSPVSDGMPSSANLDAAGADSGKQPAKETAKPRVIRTIPYQKPDTSGLLFAETFDFPIFDRWVKSSNPKFSGTWENALRNEETIVNDRGLKVMNPAQHHGIATRMPTPLTSNQGKGLVISYEVKFEQELECGGAYLKMFNTANLAKAQLSDFDNTTPYVIMFGPDRCGSTRKVHLIIQQYNPISEKWVEHHLDNAPTVPTGTDTHVYTVQLAPDNTYSVLIDNVVARTGKMDSDFVPPFTPATEIPDEKDVKPDDWVDEQMIPDPEAVKPDDWDETAPAMIPDVNAVKPDDWLEDEEMSIPNPDAVKPDYWNDEDDGEWTRPTIPNPVCASASGCGKWERPLIPNVAYKGKWVRPKITNPAYKGPWQPRNIPNPFYFVSENPHAVADIDAIGFELWTMQDGILFDNIVISRSIEPVTAFIQKTWKIRSELEAERESIKQSSNKRSASDKDEHDLMTFSGLKAKFMTLAAAYPIQILSAVVVSLLMILRIVRSKSLSATPQVTATPLAPTPEVSESKKSKPKGDNTKKSSSTDSNEENDSADEDESLAADETTEELKEKPAVTKGTPNGGTRKRTTAAKRD